MAPRRPKYTTIGAPMVIQRVKSVIFHGGSSIVPKFRFPSNWGVDCLSREESNENERRFMEDGRREGSRSVEYSVRQFEPQTCCSHACWLHSIGCRRFEWFLLDYLYYPKRLRRLIRQPNRSCLHLSSQTSGCTNVLVLFKHRRRAACYQPRRGGGKAQKSVGAKSLTEWAVLFYVRRGVKYM